ncbi:rhomboid family intramembrane serine protease [Halocola ammonii]
MKKFERARILNALFFTVIYLLICWTLFLSDEWMGTDFKHQFGMRPWSLEGLLGIIGHPFLHGSYDHIWQNTLAFAVLNMFLFYFYRQIALKVFFIIFFGTGVLLWLMGQPGSNHIGASGVIYGLAAFLFFSGIFRNNENLLRVALVVAFAYGSMFWYIFPIKPNMSWEGHLSGAMIGVIFAYFYKGEGPKRKKYNWEIEEEIEEKRAEMLKDAEDFSQYHGTENFTIHYTFKPTPKKEDEKKDKPENKKPPENSEG